MMWWQRLVRAEGSKNMGIESVEGARGAMPVYVSTPKGPGPWPGVVVVSDALGMTSDLHQQADWLAGEGFLAAAPDLHYWGSRTRCLMSLMRQMLAGKGDAFTDIGAAHRWLAKNSSCTGTIGVIGFCMGGGFALMLASNGDYGAASANYGMLPRDVVKQLADACPVVASYGGRDRTLPGASEKLRRALDVNEIVSDVKEYPDAGHSFLNDHVPDEIPWWVTTTSWYGRTGYHEESAIDARQRIAEFFHRHLDPQS